MLTRVICDDLSYSLQMYDKIAEEWERTKIVWFATLNELREARQPYLNNKDWVIVFDDEDLRRDIFRYYLKSSDRINIVESSQRRKYELERIFNDIVRNIHLREKDISPDDAKSAALKIMENENKEHLMLQDEMPSRVASLVSLKATAQSLIKRLQPRK